MAKKQRTPISLWEVTTEMFLSEPEVDSLLSHLRKSEQTSPNETKIRAGVDRLIVEILLFSGLRNSELCHLKVSDTKGSRSESAIRVTGTPKQDRLVYIPNSLNASIVHFVKTIRPEYLPDKISAHDETQPLILNERGRPYDRTALYRRVVRILSEAGLEDRASVQLLRHTYGYLAYKRTGGNLLFVQRQLGHAHPMVTAVYAQFVDFPYTKLADQVSAEDRIPETLRTYRTRKSHLKHKE